MNTQEAQEVAVGISAPDHRSTLSSLARAGQSPPGDAGHTTGVIIVGIDGSNLIECRHAVCGFDYRSDADTQQHRARHTAHIAIVIDNQHSEILQQFFDWLV